MVAAARVRAPAPPPPAVLPPDMVGAAVPPPLHPPTPLRAKKAGADDRVG